jgi:hypothetical protein
LNIIKRLIAFHKPGQGYESILPDTRSILIVHCNKGMLQCTIAVKRDSQKQETGGSESEEFPPAEDPNEATDSARKYPTSALLRSSAGLGWSAISAELRAHGVSETPVVVPQYVELCHAVAGNNNGLVRRSGAGQCQEFIPTTGAICLAPIGVGDNTTTITAPIPKTMHLYLPTTLFRRLSDDFNLPGAPAHSIRYVAGDEVLNQIVLSILFSSQASFTRVFRRTTGMTPGEYRRRRHTSAQILLGTSAPQVQFDHNAATI